MLVLGDMGVRGFLAYVRRNGVCVSFSTEAKRGRNAGFEVGCLSVPLMCSSMARVVWVG